jgi:hypothetical protein
MKSRNMMNECAPVKNYRSPLPTAQITEDVLLILRHWLTNVHQTKVVRQSENPISLYQKDADFRLTHTTAQEGLHFPRYIKELHPYRGESRLSSLPRWMLHRCADFGAHGCVRGNAQEEIQLVTRRGCLSALRETVKAATRLITGNQVFRRHCGTAMLGAAAMVLALATGCGAGGTIGANGGGGGGPVAGKNTTVTLVVSSAANDQLQRFALFLCPPVKPLVRTFFLTFSFHSAKSFRHFAE